MGSGAGLCNQRLHLSLCGSVALAKLLNLSGLQFSRLYLLHAIGLRIDSGTCHGLKKSETVLQPALSKY